MNPENFTNQTWFNYLDDGLKEQAKLAAQLYELSKKNSNFFDYSFVVFPIAKAYEGFLKQFFLDLDLIDQRTYESRRFRIGRALNPDISYHQRDEDWLFDKVAQVCGEELARALWEDWLEGRNRLFHYFPGKNVVLNLAGAEQFLERLSNVMTRALTCESMQNRKEQA